MNSESPCYEEHRIEQLHGFTVVDATSRHPGHEHDNLVWVGCREDGRWLTPDQATQLARAITRTVASHQASHAAEVAA